MDRKMRARRNNAEAKVRKSRNPVGVVFTDKTEGSEVNRLLLPTGDTVPVLIDHDQKTFEQLPEKSKMS